MKKAYQIPLTTIVAMETHLMQIASAQLDRSQKITSSDAFGARQSNGWDDEE